MNYSVFRSFIEKFDTYQKEEQEVIAIALDKIKGYIETNQAPYGLRIKRLSHRIYEGRVNIHIRIAYFKDKDVVKFFCFGNHDDIKRCLRNLRY